MKGPIKVYSNISRRFERGSIFKIGAESGHVDTVIPSLLNLIWNMSSLVRQDN